MTRTGSPSVQAPAPLPLPAHYDPAQAASWAYRPDETALAASAAAWRRTHGIRPSGADERRLHLLLIDVQKDFCFPEGSLYVAGRSGTMRLSPPTR